MKYNYHYWTATIFIKCAKFLNFINRNLTVFIQMLINKGELHLKIIQLMDRHELIKEQGDE